MRDEDIGWQGMYVVKVLHLWKGLKHNHEWWKVSIVLLKPTKNGMNEWFKIVLFIQYHIMYVDCWCIERLREEKANYSYYINVESNEWEWKIIYIVYQYCTRLTNYIDKTKH